MLENKYVVSCGLCGEKLEDGKCVKCGGEPVWVGAKIAPYLDKVLIYLLAALAATVIIMIVA